jgi:methylenetetrahydrofolate reductase (NADPH)
MSQANTAAVPTEAALKTGSNLEWILAEGRFAVTAELGPPRGWDAAVVRKKAQTLKGWCDAANVTDNQAAVVHMSSIATGLIMIAEGLEPIIQMTCRDRNRLAMQSDLLGAAAHGVHNLLCLSGDHQSKGDHPGAKNVHDIDSIQLVGMVRAMRDENRYQNGQDIPGGGPRIFIGAAENPFADPAAMRPYRLRKKALAGADFIQTQLVYDVARFREFMKKVVDLGVHEKLSILAGVGPLKSPGMARHLRQHVPGMVVPEAFDARLEAAVKGIDPTDKLARSKAWREEGKRICVDLIQEIREIEGVAGVHVMAIEWEEAVPEIVKAAGLRPDLQG